MIEEASALALVGVKQTAFASSSISSPRVEWVLADKIQVQQVILNLMRNAIEAMHEATRRELTISTAELPSEMVEVSVSDTGPGIAPEIAAQLFHPFVTTKPHGMGVGLSISRTIVEVARRQTLGGTQSRWRSDFPIDPEGAQQGGTDRWHLMPWSI